jgi:dTDP-4-dehydrorhamnose reductase
VKVLIAGAGGQVGQALMAAAPAANETVATPHDELDIVDQNSVAALVAAEKPDLIINAAAYTAVDKAETETERASQVNEVGARNLAAAALRSGARLIHISTDFVFSGESSTPYAPESVPAPLGIYGATKLAGEQAVLDVLHSRAIVLRTAWVYSHTGKNFVLTMLRLMRENGSVRVVADQFGSPTSAASIAKAIWAISAKPEMGGIYHWTDAGIASWYDFAVAISEEAADAGLLPAPAEVVPIGTEDYPTRAQRPRFSVLDTRATVDAIGIQPPHWRANLRRVLDEVPRD